MGQNKEEFGDKLKKIAESIDIIESLYFSRPIKISIDVSFSEYLEIANYLKTNTDDDKCIISIGNTDVTFLKK
jgi:hypothetical protein